MMQSAGEETRQEEHMDCRRVRLDKGPLFVKRLEKGGMGGGVR